METIITPHTCAAVNLNCDQVPGLAKKFCTRHLCTLCGVLQMTPNVFGPPYCAECIRTESERASVNSWGPRTGPRQPNWLVDAMSTGV
jgi:hypothetical protein